MLLLTIDIRLNESWSRAAMGCAGLGDELDRVYNEPPATISRNDIEWQSVSSSWVFIGIIKDITWSKQSPY